MAEVGTAIRGRRVPLATAPRAKDDRPVVGYVCGAKPLPFGHIVLTEGVEVPGAENWTRLEAWVSARRIRPIHEGEGFFPYEVFAAWEDAVVEAAERELGITAAVPQDMPPLDEQPPAADKDAKATELKAKRQAAAAKAREAKQAKKAAQTTKE